MLELKLIYISKRGWGQLHVRFFHRYSNSTWNSPCCNSIADYHSYRGICDFSGTFLAICMRAKRIPTEFESRWLNRWWYGPLVDETQPAFTWKLWCLRSDNKFRYSKRAITQIKNNWVAVGHKPFFAHLKGHILNTDVSHRSLAVFHLTICIHTQGLFCECA